jgi:hypothetical protein
MPKFGSVLRAAHEYTCVSLSGHSYTGPGRDQLAGIRHLTNCRSISLKGPEKHPPQQDRSGFSRNSTQRRSMERSARTQRKATGLGRFVESEGGEQSRHKPSVTAGD